jgi:hypothetical protein
VSRDDPRPDAREELDALERILAREPVGEEHLELAALVDSVRADAPRMDPEFAARLDAAVERRLARRRRLPRPALSPSRLALAGGGLVAAAVAFTIVITSGVLDRGTGTPAPPLGGASQHAATRPPLHSPASAPTKSATAGPTKARSPVNATAPAPAHSAPAPSVSFASGGARLVHRTSALVLATGAGSLAHVADEIVALTERQSGVVASSYVDVQGAASRASFSLRVPSARLHTLIAGLSSLASVRSLTQDTNDVTSGDDRVLAVLSARRSERATLARRLAHAASIAQSLALRRRIAVLDGLIAWDVRSVAAFEALGRTAALHVDLKVDATPKGAAGGGGGGPLAGASRTALRALEELLAVALVALAIALPVALCALALWWGAAAVRQRSRERALRAT